MSTVCDHPPRVDVPAGLEYSVIGNVLRQVVEQTAHQVVDCAIRSRRSHHNFRFRLDIGGRLKRPYEVGDELPRSGRGGLEVELYPENGVA